MRFLLPFTLGPKVEAAERVVLAEERVGGEWWLLLKSNMV